ncbi:phosphatidylinositol phosphatase PTPRQ-like [Haliotis rubra]|uniref:phosphatidylinositol phosphatase PTPRQ-like n=1 Tax=Haliotis rubra TaxID=36100 RepID=UPI001EE50CC8|nr:phosphatidylinositol phosphatase PTPRQ-like [Haliotis rubra]
MAVLSPPKKFWASVNSSSSVTLFWTHADHQDGPTTYYITVGEAANLTSDSFQEKMVVSVSGFYSTSVLVESLRSYWNYTFNITAATPVGNSSVLSVNETVRTKESAPGKVENLRIHQDPGNYTSVEVIFSCPKETERHGVIRYYKLSYEAKEKYITNVTENPQGLMISAQPESNCNYSQVVSVTPQTNYKFSVVAHDSFPGSETTERYFEKIGTPGKVSDFTSTSTTSTSTCLSWEPPTYPNGYILGYILYVHTDDRECQQAVYIVCTDCQSHGTFRVEDDRCRRSRNVTVQKLETSPTNYDVTDLLSYTNYTFTVAAVNNFSMGINTSLAVQTDIGVPLVPGNLSASVVNASSVEVTWTPPTHKSGPTNYTIIPQQATGRLSSTFENIRNVTVNGYKSSKTTINSLLSSWRYTFSIVASTSKRGSLPVDLGSNIITQESQPCEVQNLKVSSIPGNFTAVHLAWDCPKERERNGFIRNYTIQYSDLGEVDKVYGHYKPEDPCDKTHIAILPVRPEHDYTFTVSAIAMYRGKPKQSNVFHATAGKPLKKDSTEIFISRAAQNTGAATDTSIVISFDSKTLLDGTNGKVVEAGILVMKKSETPPTDPEHVTDWDTWKNWYLWKNSGYKGSYRPTPQHYLMAARIRRSASPGESLTSYSVGVDENCDSEKDQFCNGPLEPDTAYMVVAVSCTSAGCTSTEPFGNFKTKPLDDVTPWIIAFGVITALLLCVIIILVIYFKVVQPVKTQRSRGKGPALELSLRGTGQSEDIPFEVACGSTSDYQDTHANRYYENVDSRNQHTYESLASQVNDHDMHLYETVQDADVQTSDTTSYIFLTLTFATIKSKFTIYIDNMDNSNITTANVNTIFTTTTTTTTTAADTYYDRHALYYSWQVILETKVTNITATFVGETYIALGWTNPNDTNFNRAYSQRS